jgi:hypothetical protein
LGWVFLHSPLVGPLTWQPLAQLRAQRGEHVAVPSLAEASEATYAGFAGAVADQVSGYTSVVLVAHSRAGALLPAVSAALSVPVRAAVFVDAILPHPGRSWLAGMPPDRAARLRELAVEGHLPPWHTWFPEDALREVLPDPRQRAAFVAEVPALPLSYVDEPAPDVPAWPPPACGYLQLSAAYRDEAARAEAAGWPTLRRELDHLAVLTRPADVSQALDELTRPAPGAPTFWS